MSLWSGSSLAILQALHLGARSVSEIVRETGLSQSNVSNHLARLRQHQIVTAHRVGKQVFYAMSDYALALFVQNRSAAAVSGPSSRPVNPRGDATAPAAGSRPLDRSTEALRPYLDALIAGETEAALRAVGRAIAAGLTWQEVYLEIFTPALHEVGRLWEQGSITIAQEHAATALTERIMGLLARVDRAPWLPRAGTVIVACPEGEAHALGARMVADFFVAAGWSTHYLGASVPVGDLVAFVRAMRPDVVAFSCALPQNLEILRETAARLRASHGAADPPRILAGGRALADAPLPDPDLFDLVESDIHRALAFAGAAVPGERRTD